MKTKKSIITLFVIGILGVLGGGGCALGAFLMPQEEREELLFPEVPSAKIDVTDQAYSVLTGEKLASAELVSAPIYCIQTPNGTDGARPQVGLTKAGVIFEAIAEAGITRFAALYQNPTSAVIGPIRSLRLYYLEWDTPFDCTIVHAGGADDAIAAVRAGGYKDLTENYTYMYRGSASTRRWNNLFTTSANLARMNTDRSYGSSNAKGFSRLTPEEAEKERINALAINPLVITKATDGDTSALGADSASIRIHYGYAGSFNVNYNYNLTTNSYDRSYESGAIHEVYTCPDEDLGQKNPEDICTLTTLSPKVVIAMMVSESKASDNYHESIRTTGSGKAYIFQNGTATIGTWSKPTRDEQISFLDSEGNEIKLIPGQTFISAVPEYGSVDF